MEVNHSDIARKQRSEWAINVTDVEKVRKTDMESSLDFQILSRETAKDANYANIKACNDEDRMQEVLEDYNGATGKLTTQWHLMLMEVAY